MNFYNIIVQLLRLTVGSLKNGFSIMYCHKNESSFCVILELPIIHLVLILIGQLSGTVIQIF
jgi:hypothetical protein